MRNYKDTMIAILLIVLHVCGGLWSQSTLEDQAEMKGQEPSGADAVPFVPEALPEMSGTIEFMADLPAGRVISYDPSTGEETILDTNPNLEDMQQKLWISDREIDQPEVLGNPFDLMNFSDLNRIMNPEDLPWSPNCKIYFSRHGIRYTASGILIDPYHVLCAGHIVHEGNGGIWSSDVVVMPSYNDGISRYGNAKNINLYSWESWILHGNLKHNIGVIRLDRPIGALTEWFNCGWTDDMSFYQRAYFHNSAYPAEAPYNGQYMYYWSGTIDGLDYPLLMANRKGFGGMDGSGAYWIDPTGLRYVVAILSYYNDDQTLFAAITENKLNDIQDLIDDFTPSKFDLISLKVTASPERVRAGNQLDSMSYIVYNHSTSTWIGTVGVDVYLSTNDFISTSDIFLDKHYFSYRLEPMEKVRVTVSTPPRIPWNLLRGNYWIGVILDISDNDMSNNVSHGQDAALIDTF